MLVSALIPIFLGAAAAQQCTTGVGTLTNTNPPAPIVIAGNSAGSAASYSDNAFNFRLTGAPTTNVVVRVATSSPNTNVSVSSLTFSPTNWSTAQAVTLRIANQTMPAASIITDVSFTPVNTGGVSIPPIVYRTNISLSQQSLGGCWFSPMSCFLW